MRTQPKVIHVMHGFGAGGAERLVYELASRLPKRDFETEVVTVLGSGPLEAMFKEAHLPYRVFTRQGVFGWKTLRELIRFFRVERPDIVHTHLFLADTWGRIAARLAGVRIVISTEHNVNVSYGVLHHTTNRILSLFTTAHIAISQEVKRYLMATEGISEQKIRVVLNGTDLSSVIPRGSRPFRDVPQILAVGRLYPQKGYPTLLKALAHVKQPWQLSIVGTGPDERELRDLAERLRISPRIKWLGFRNDVPQLLAEADLFCFPSSYEGLGLSAVEAAAAGVPIIASDLPALHEIFKTTDLRFVPAGNVTEWAHALREILRDPVDAVLRANRAVPNIQATMSIDRMVDGYAKVYRDLL